MVECTKNDEYEPIKRFGIITSFMRDAEYLNAIMKECIVLTSLLDDSYQKPIERYRELICKVKMETFEF